MEDRDKDNKIDEETTVTSEGGETETGLALHRNQTEMMIMKKFVMSAVVRRARPVQ